MIAIDLRKTTLKFKPEVHIRPNPRKTNELLIGECALSEDIFLPFSPETPSDLTLGPEFNLGAGERSVSGLTTGLQKCIEGPTGNHYLPASYFIGFIIR